MSADASSASAQLAGGHWSARRPLASGRLLLPLFVLGLFAFNLLLHYPGQMNNDSIGQMEQAATGRYTDWHPPVMAWLWSLLLPIAKGPAPMLVLHLLVYWAGVGLLADGLRRAGHPALAWLVAACGAFPPFLYLNAVITKDAGITAAWMGAVGLVAWWRLQDRRLPLGVVIAAVALLAYGTLVRANAVFAIGALALWAFSVRRQPGAVRLVVASVLCALLALPASAWVNRHVFQAEPTHAVFSLFLFDLNGIAAHRNDPSLLEPRATLTPAELQACYTPYWWDSLSPWGRCGSRVNKPAGDTYVTEPEGIERQWLATIAQNPGAWLAHRLKHFNSSLLFLIPRMHIRFTPEYIADGQWQPSQQVSERQVRWDLLRKNPASWPVVWLVWGAFLAGWLARTPGPFACEGTPGTARRTLALALCLSALAYSGAYLVIGVATDMRYHYWSLLALLLATAVTLPQWWQHLRQRSPLLVAGVAGVVLVTALGTAARLADWRGLF
ncbi:hypothetical protein JI739_21590 [Ramlibacter sp. AW1]|uniref:Uncharacterized protein n=1 Tax=Ramlibacter aurantiacus TaxID=2801330 RepID=A0A937D3Q3_9BURK|nr:hypothetical protein [Ramlibacter aurantiacus]MBL0422944.1 hypothetical protein [Ramlibacter aurantiacus]